MNEGSRRANVIGIIGLSYCGSTVLNYMLDSHPAIYGGSELRRLSTEGATARCGVCGIECSVWPEDVVQWIYPLEELYSTLRAGFGVKVIADASKNLGHFKKVLAADQSARLSFIVLTKHPIRHLASYVTNVGGNSKQKADYESEDEFIRNTVEKMHSFYDAVEDRVGAFERRGFVLTVAYEDVVLRPSVELPKIIQPCGLEYDSRMLSFDRFEHHPIGGNMGPAVQTARQHGGVLRWGANSEYRRKFYEENQGIVLDNKYLETFSPERIYELARDPRIRALSERLGYGELPGVGRGEV